MKKQKQYIFYKTTYVNDGRFYYGSHYGYLNDNYRGSNKIISYIKKKHGIEKLKRENLKFFNRKEDMFAFESRFLKFYKLDQNPKCLNMTSNGCGGDTWSHMTEEEILKRKRKLSSKISGEGNGNYGRKFSEEHLKKISESRKGIKIHTEHHKKELSERLKREHAEGKRNNINFLKAVNNRAGCKLSEKHKEKISESLKSSEKYKNGRSKAIETCKKKMQLKLEIFKNLIDLNLNKDEIIKRMNIKHPTFHKYYRLINKKTHNEI